MNHSSTYSQNQAANYAVNQAQDHSSNPATRIEEVTDVTRMLAARALGVGSVFKTALDAGLTLFAYPAERELLIGVGYHRDVLTPNTIETALQRRFQSPQRFTCWLPALLADGSFFMLQRRTRTSSDSDTCNISPEEIGNALALFEA